MKYNYDLVFSSRKTISVSISPLNRICVRCPYGTKISEIEAFLNSKESWIDKCITENSLILAENEGVIDLEQIYLNGSKYPLEISDKNQFKDGVVYVKHLKHIKSLFCNDLSAGFLTRLEQYAKFLKTTPTSVSFKDYTAKWGCCDGKNNIIFNYRLLMLPVELQDYVAVHELCHIIRHDHSGRFWKQVEAVVPDYQYKRKLLNYYRFLNSMY